jgi:endoglycosylceramidase
VLLGPLLTYSGVASMNVNLVRLVISWDRIEQSAPTDGQHHWNTAALGLLDTEITWFEERGISVLIDFHQYDWSSYFIPSAMGVPAWYYADGRFAIDQVDDAQAAFWTTEERRSLAAYSAFVAMIVSRYKDQPNVLGYDIWNEPAPGMLGDNPAAFAAISRWEASIRSAVRSIDANRTVFISCCAIRAKEAQWSDFDAFGDTRHLAFDFHDYWPGAATKVYSQTLNDQLRYLSPILSKARANDVPVLIGEWGIPNASANGETYQAQMLDIFSRQGLSNARWFFWPNSTGRYSLIMADGTLTPLALQLAHAWARM